MNECLPDNGNCSDVCVNDVPFYHCECPTGAQLDPANNLTCVFNADCSQETGCECLPGYRNTSTDSSLNCTGKQHAFTNENWRVAYLIPPPSLLA